MISRRHTLLGLLAGGLTFWRRHSVFARSVQRRDRIIHRIAFGSCAFQWKEQPIWSVIAEREPDLFLFIGDAIYGDFDGKKPFTPTADSREPVIYVRNIYKYYVAYKLLEKSREKRGKKAAVD